MGKIRLGIWRAGDSDMEHDRLLYETAKKAIEFLDAPKAKAAATRRAYNSDWRQFEGWCEKNGLTSLPAEPSSMARYVDYRARPEEGGKPCKVATISRRLSSINAAHKLVRLDAPATMNESRLTETLQEIRRTFAAQQQTRKKPPTPARIAQILDTLDGSVTAARNSALPLTGVAGALRSSDLAAMRLEDLKWHEKGIAIDLSRPIEHGAKHRTIEIPFGGGDQPCPVKALEDWLTVAKLEGGPVFCGVGAFGTIGKGINPTSIGRLVQNIVRKAQISSPRSYGAHSIRRGYETEGRASGPDRQMASQAGHPSKATIRRQTLVDQTDKRAAARALGL
jgi:integrase